MLGLSSSNPVLRSFAAGFALQSKVVMTRPMTIATGVITPTMFLTILIFARATPPSAREVSGAVISALLASLWAASIWGGIGILRQERQMGTFAKSITSVSNPRAILLGKMASASVCDTIIIIASCTVYLLIVQMPLHLGRADLIILGLLSVILSGIASSLMIGTALIISRHGFQIAQVIGAPILLLGGTILPVEYLPEWISWISRLISLSWFRDFLVSTSGTVEWLSLSIALTLTVIYLLIGLRLFTVMLDRARIEGTLELW